MFHQLIKCLNYSKNQRGDGIRIFKLEYNISICDDELLSILPFIPNLEVFVVKHAENLTDGSLIFVSNYCKLLKNFSVSGALASYRTMHHLGKCRQLQQLRLAACLNLTAMALLPFADLPIEQLDLSGCKWLTVSDTAYDLRSLNQLTHLNLICCDNISADFLLNLTGFVNLQDFSITGNAIIDDYAMIPFIKSHPNLRDLFLLECAISDDTLRAISEFLPQLNHLDISFCTRITAQGIRYLILHCPYLKLLGLKYCGISKADFPELILDEIEVDTLKCKELDKIRDIQEDVEDSYAYLHHFLSTEQLF